MDGKEARVKKQISLTQKQKKKKRAQPMMASCLNWMTGNTDTDSITVWCILTLSLSCLISTILSLFIHSAVQLPAGT